MTTANFFYGESDTFNTTSEINIWDILNSFVDYGDEDAEEDISNWDWKEVEGC